MGRPRTTPPGPEGVDERGAPIDVVDHRRDASTERARRQREDALAFLADRELFRHLIDDERFSRVRADFRGAVFTRGKHRRCVPFLGSVHGFRPVPGNAAVPREPP